MHHNNNTNNHVGFSWGFSSANASNINITPSPTKISALKQEKLSVFNKTNDELAKQSKIIRQPQQQENSNLRLKRRATSTSSNDENGDAFTYRHAKQLPHWKFKPTAGIKKPQVSPNHSIKRKSNISTIIQSQPLPVTRSLELLDREQLTELLTDLLSLNNPTLTSIIQTKISTNYKSHFSIDKCLSLLKLKYEAILSNIPYNKNYELNSSHVLLDDYAFIRLKSSILEFLNCLIDFILNNIPPNFNNLHESLKFLNHCTFMVINLPRFQLSSNNYYYDKCMEQLSFIWCTIFEHLTKDMCIATLNGKEFLFSWISKLNDYNEFTNGMFERPLNLFKSLDLDIDDAQYLTTNNEKSINTMDNITNSSLQELNNSSSNNSNDNNNNINGNPSSSFTSAFSIVQASPINFNERQ
ncbi:hypothetical protein NCAS_0E01950 [Naumovozyma castellii]|uniref:Tethering factor for nuclear proteasome STS1 n=1 Tax=Naumovozyma castellii TaxID=27288 RepID=G0VFJ9_NAUCA|nr:hypothetical protein NCAS_0E01950 [Naumovozyma castellii CBS 4309]CCC70265.1 hypothetical protein NCAS_0E01950 [Naumovozyma castellii CBS 4309]